MGGKSPGSAYFTVQATIDEKTILDDAAAEAGMNRNQFIRLFINSLTQSAGKVWLAQASKHI